jgi:hypothetical protein
MTTAFRFAVADSAEDPDAEIWFAEPPGFTAVPLDALLPPADSPAADTLRTAFEPILRAAPDEMVRREFVARCAQAQQMLGALREVGTVHCSIGLHRDDVDERGERGGGTPLLSFFTVSWRATAVSPRAVTAARAVGHLDGQAPIEYVELPCGPATFGETVRAAGAESGLPRMPLVQFHAHVPHPDCKRLAVLTLSTTAVERREQYRAVLRRIAFLVSFDSPLDPGSRTSL